jgi:hypothetical protein
VCGPASFDDVSSFSIFVVVVGSNGNMAAVALLVVGRKYMFRFSCILLKSPHCFIRNRANVL